MYRIYSYRVKFTLKRKAVVVPECIPAFKYIT